MHPSLWGPTGNIVSDIVLCCLTADPALQFDTVQVQTHFHMHTKTL